MTLDGSAETNKPQGEHSVKGSWTPTLSLRLNTAGAAERLLAAIAHELRNPIEGLGNALYLLRLSGTNDQVELIDTAESELQRIRQIVTALLDEYKRSSVERVRVSLAEVIEETLAFYEHKIRFKKIKVEKQFSAPGDIEAVPGQMRQVFTNLIINSLEAVAPEMGKLTVRISESCDWRHLEVRGTRATIADNGVGIAPENMEKIFSGTFTSKGDKGTGVGLWMARQILNNHSASIRVRSSVLPGRSGTCFSIFVPCAHKAHVMPATDS
jgi:two-component system CheB/CheR fusion protein